MGSVRNFILLPTALAVLVVASAPCAAGRLFVPGRQIKVERTVVRARLVSNRLACTTQGDAGRFAFVDFVDGTVLYYTSEAGEARRFRPSLLCALGGKAVILDELINRLDYYGTDGNSTASCALAEEVLAVKHGAPVDLLPLGERFGEGFLILSERGMVLTVNAEGRLVARTSLREAFNLPEAFFARGGGLTSGKLHFAFSPNTAKMLLFSHDGGAHTDVDLSRFLPGEAMLSDAVALADNEFLVARGAGVFLLANGAATALPLGAKFSADAPLQLDWRDSLLLIYNSQGEMLVGELK